MNNIRYLLLIFFLFSIAGCNGLNSKLVSEYNFVEFQNNEYGFEFLYPSGWDEVKRDLPDRWAIMNDGDTILFTVNKAEINNLLALGKIQAIRDLNPESEDKRLNPEDINDVNVIVKLESFNEHDWYTYAIKFSDKNVDSIISGTLCKDYEINLVMVSKSDTFEDNKELYNNILNSFDC